MPAMFSHPIFGDISPRKTCRAKSDASDKILVFSDGSISA
jgi:hypothetical protein